MRNFFIKLTPNHAIFALYLLLPWVFFGIGYDVLRVPFAPGDGYIGGIPTKLFAVNLSAWNPYLQAGTFAFKDIGFQFLYLPAILIISLFPNPFGFNFLLFLHYSLIGFFTFLFLRKLDLDEMASFTGGLIFMFCGFNAAHLAHYMIIMTLAYLPLVLYFLESFFVSRRFFHLFLAALAFSLSIFADYTAVSLYIGMVSLPYIIFRILTGEEFRSEPLWHKLRWSILTAGITFFGGLLTASAQVFPILESLPLVTRERITYEFFASFSFPLYQFPILLFPYLFGANKAGLYPAGYFGEPNLMELSGYVGILPLFMAGLALLLPARNKQTFFWTAVAAIGFLLVLGDSTPFYRLMYRVPLYNMFRVPARNWLEVSFAIAVLSAFFLHRIKRESLPKKQYLGWLSALTALFALIVFVLLSAWPALFPHLREQKGWTANVHLASPAIYIPLILATLSLAALYLLYRYRKSHWAWSGIAVLVFLDLFSFGHFFNTYPNLLFFEGRPNEAAQFILRDENHRNSRIFSINFQGLERELQINLNMLYGIPAINGYSNLWLKEYGQLTTFSIERPTGNKKDLLANNLVLSTLSTKYLITSIESQKEYLENIVLLSDSPSGKTLVREFSANGWEFHSAEVSPSGEIITLRASNGQMSLAQFPFAIGAETYYMVDFEARTLTPTNAAQKPLILDFFGKNYDKAGQERVLNQAALSDEFRPFHFIIFSDERVPPSAYLRLFTYAATPYEVRNVTLTQLDEPRIPLGYRAAANLPGSISPVYRLAHETPDGIAIYENLNFLPRARFVEQVIPVNTWGDVFYYLWYAPNFNPARTALAQDFDISANLEPGRILRMDDTNPERVSLTVETGENSFLVLADSWYPGWRVYIDGKESKIYKTYGVLRGVLIHGDGEHTLEFRFFPASFYLGLFVTALTCIFLFLGTSYLDRRNLT